MITFRDIENLKDDDTVILTGKVMKELLEITRGIRAGSTKLDYVMGGRLTSAICEATPITISFKTPYGK